MRSVARPTIRSPGRPWSTNPKDENLRAGRMDPEAESGKIAIAEDLVPVTGRQSIHDPFREGEALPLRHVHVLPRPASRVLTGRCRRTSTPSRSLSPASPAFAAGNADTIESLDLTVETTEAGPPGWRPDKEPPDYVRSSCWRNTAAVPRRSGVPPGVWFRFRTGSAVAFCPNGSLFSTESGPDEDCA